MRFEDLAGQRFQEDLRAAAGYSPITETELKNAYARYKDVGVKLGRVKGKSDSALYKQATNDVLAWWKHQKKAEADAKAAKRKAEAEARRRAEQAARGAGGSGSGGSRSSGGTGGGGSRSRGAMLPDTAIGSGGPSTQMVSIAYVETMLARNGFTGARVPEYARRSKADFDAWLARAIRYRQAQSPYTYATRAPVGQPSTGTQTVYKPIATNRAPVIR